MSRINKKCDANDCAEIFLSAQLLEKQAKAAEVAMSRLGGKVCVKSIDAIAKAIRKLQHEAGEIIYECNERPVETRKRYKIKFPQEVLKAHDSGVSIKDLSRQYGRPEEEILETLEKARNWKNSKSGHAA